MSDFLSACKNIVGDSHVLSDEAAMQPYMQDKRGRQTGRACAVVSPASTDEVAALVKLCNTHRVPIVPQGGNTGLVLGSIPDKSGTALLLSLRRMQQIRAVDPINNTITVEAGCILAHVQQAAEGAQRLFPLSLGAEGSCTIGGNLSSNAGGTAVLRYGNARELCLGLEVVTASGDIWHGLRGLRKDNTGYDLRDLYIGAEGTLGIITAAVLKLFPRPRAMRTALVAVDSAEHALQLLTLMQARCNAGLTGFELMSTFCMTLVQKHFPSLNRPFRDAPAFQVLIELSDSESEQHAITLLEESVGSAIERGIALDAVIATSEAQSQMLWKWRESIPLAQAAEGHNIKHDVSLPISNIAAFIKQTDALLIQQFPGIHTVTFGHLGDGNLHYNVARPHTMPENDFLALQPRINRVVHDSVHAMHGSISAEHGLGALKREEILRYKSAVEISLMRSIKLALDPLNLMNPGKVL